MLRDAKYSQGYVYSAMTRLKQRQELLIDLVLGIALLAAILSVTYLYVSSEHIFYWSDYSGYQNITHAIVAHSYESPGAAIGAIAGSMGSDYNAIFTIPLVPVIRIFGESRLVYELGLAVVYLLPFTLVLAAVAVKLIPLRPRAVFWSTVALTLLTPMVWEPTLRGYPDTGAAFAIALAVWIYLYNTRLDRWWQIPLIGFLLVAAMLFRRHFAYAATAFVGALVLHALTRFAARMRQRMRESLRELCSSAVRIALVVVVASLVLLVFGRSFVHRILTVDYNELYASYLDPSPVVLRWYLEVYGWAATICAAVGLILGIRRRTAQLDVAVFIAIFGGLSLIQWSLVVRQIGEHYTLHFTPTIVLGLAALVWTVWTWLRGRRRALALCAVSLVMIANMVAGLTSVGSAASVVRPLFALNTPPLTRPDYDQVVQLVDYLRGQAAQGEPIYVVASSGIMNRDLLPNAEHALYGWDGSRLNIMPIPHIDSRDFLPLEMLLQAQYVLVVEPFQHQLDVDQQRVVKVVFDLFAENQEIAHDFVRLPTTFALADGAVVHIYQRTRRSSLQAALRALHAMQRSIRTSPGGQLDWMVIDQPYPASITKQQDSTYSLTTHPNEPPIAPSTTFLYLGGLPERGVLSGSVSFLDKRCAGATLRLSRVTADDQVSDIAAIQLHPDGPADFSVAFAKQDAANLLLTVSSCSLEIDHLSLRQGDKVTR